DALLEALMGFQVSTGQHVTPAALANELETQLAVAISGKTPAVSARFEDLLDLEADRLLAGSGSQTHTGSLDAASPIAHERTATMQSDPAIESTGSEPDDADQDTPELEDESGESDVEHERRRTMPEFELIDARRVDPTTGKPVAEDDVVLTTPAPA